MSGQEGAPYFPGARVEVIDGQARELAHADGVVLYVGSDAKVLVGWDDESTSVLPQEALALKTANDSPD